MAGKIRVLSENMIHKIAAGEVIERPASVVKELVENSIDARARRIHIAAVAGGKQSIVVSDDGMGMSREDAELSVLRHSTSKMSSPSDLFAISTLGFRGEALASIGAVSRMIIETRVEEEPEGTRVWVEGGIKREVIPIGRAPGTTVSVRNMFFNTPARRKFLRQVDTEGRHIAQSVVQLAAAYPEVTFELGHQERNVLSFAGTGRRERAAELLGIDADSLLHAEWEEGGIGMEGFLSPPAFCRRSKGKQFIIVRGRPVVSRGLSQSVYQGFGGLLPEEKHPSFVLWLELDPRRIDVNVHPTKREVRLADQRKVEEAMQAGVRKVLGMAQAPSFVYQPDPSEFQAANIGEIKPVSFGEEREKTDEAGESRWFPPGKEEMGASQQMSLSLLSPSSPKVEKLVREGVDSAGGLGALNETMGSSSIWQAHNRYLVLQIKDGVIIIDQQGAHERILFEEALANFQSAETASQQLLFPLTVKVGLVEGEALAEAGELLKELGFGIREFGPGTVLVESIPAELRNWGEGEVFYQILNDLLEEKKIGHTLREAVAISFACRSSIQAGESLSVPEMEALLGRLLETQEPFVCPHGRPIIVKISLRELDRMFGRAW